MQSSVADQQRETLATFGFIERIEAIAATVDESAANELRGVVHEMIDSVPPVRVSAAASLLALSKPTVKAWCQRGVLMSVEDADGTPVRTLDPRRLHDVLHIVTDLRKLAARPGNLVEQVRHRLEDRALLESDELRAGLAAWRAGDAVEA